MNDRELLELAAKAVEYKYSDIEFAGESGLQLLSPNPRSNWNPLEDDGDALRLVVKLRIDIRNFTGASCCISASSKNIAEDSDEDYWVNPYASTRRAIVRAAAEIGKQIP